MSISAVQSDVANKREIGLVNGFVDQNLLKLVSCGWNGYKDQRGEQSPITYGWIICQECSGTGEIYSDCYRYGDYQGGEGTGRILVVEED